MILIVYIDDLVITHNSMKMIDSKKNDLQLLFNMTNLMILHYYLGLKVWKKGHHIFMSQMKYASTMLKKFQMMDYKHITMPIDIRLQLSHFDPSL